MKVVAVVLDIMAVGGGGNAVASCMIPPAIVVCRRHLCVIGHQARPVVFNQQLPFHARMSASLRKLYKSCGVQCNHAPCGLAFSFPAASVTASTTCCKQIPTKGLITLPAGATPSQPDAMFIVLLCCRAWTMPSCCVAG